MEKTPSIEFHERFLVNQPYERSLFTGKNFDKTLFEGICHWSRIRKGSEYDYLDAPKFTQEEMGADPISQRFVAFLLIVSRAKRVLEIGTFIGLSSMIFAEAIGPDGKVVTVEKFGEHAEVARRNIAKNGLQDRITVLEGDANDVIAGLPRDERFDAIFLDANKERYLELFLMLEPLLADTGIFLVDDCLFMGDVLNDTPTNEKAKGARAFLDHVAGRSDLVGVLVPLCAGLFILTPKR